MDLIALLEEDASLTREMEKRLRIGPGYGGAKYLNQKDHWQTWLATYRDPHSLRRAYRSGTGAEVIYNRLNCPPMVFWLGEALGAPQAVLRLAFTAACNAPLNQASQTAAVRCHLPWSMLEERMGCNLQ